MTFGLPQEEAGFIIKKLDVKIANADESDLGFEKIILVDTSGPQWISKKINLEKVVEIIDHRQVENTSEFPNAKVQIELVGSCATLITEKFMTAKIIPSEKSATLLYCAIISNTINFKNKVTTDRDRKVAVWLKNL
jgi:inorganic pyrophosphatase/exopolyphosphatase